MTAVVRTSTAGFPRTILRGGTFGLALALGALLGGGCASMSSDSAKAHGLNLDRDLPTILAQVPAPEIVRPGQELDSANALAAAANAASNANHRVMAYWGVGSSMEPLFATRTAIVVSPCDFSDLRRGMMVLYRDPDGWGIAHVLVENLPNGWTAQGVNCPEEDPNLVTPKNIVGVVTHAYASSEGEGRQTMINIMRAKLVPVTTNVSSDGMLAGQSTAR
jgi:hypothetical protein